VSEAQQLGLAHYTVPEGQGLAKALELARTIVKNAPATNYAVINGISRIGEMSMGEGFFAETMVTAMTRSAGIDASQRISAFFDGRRERAGKTGE
jgi:enoyl-CoA hydratase/carnithine racemase